LIDITENNLINSYKQVRDELGKYSKNLLKKREIIVFNKVDLLEKREIEIKKKEFMSKIKKKIFLLSTLDKKLVKSIKSKIINYVS
jgi:Predicted GTPase